MMHGWPTVSSQPFHALAAALKEGGFADHGSRLQDVLDGTWTTSSELIAELGAAVLAIRKECKPMSRDQKALVEESLGQARKVWPGLGRFSWLAFWR